MTIVTVTRHARITIPKYIINKLEIKEGDNVDVSLDDEKIIIRKPIPDLKEFHDFLPQGFDNILEKIRKDSRERFKNLGIL